jgi:hypothetical protein
MGIDTRRKAERQWSNVVVGLALADVLALEAVRVFLPDVFSHMYAAVGALTTTSDNYIGRGDPPHLKAQINQLIEAGGNHDDVVREMVARLFPGAQWLIGGPHYRSEGWKNRWLRERRVAHEDVFHLYLERVVGEGLQAFTEAEQAWARMADRLAFDSYLRSLDAERLEDVISSLEAYEDRFAPEHVVPGTIVLLNLMPQLPERQRGILDLDPRTVVRRVVYRLLRSLKPPDKVKVEEAVREILPEVTTLSAKAELIVLVGYREDAGHKLVSEPVARQMEQSLRADVRSASVDALAGEDKLLYILLLTKRDAELTEPTLKIADLPQMTLALLKSARTEVLSQAMGSWAVRRSARLAWDALIELYGNENILRKRIENLKDTQPEGVDELLDLAYKYLGGWRPRDFGDD